MRVPGANPIIRARGLSKVYRLYAKPHYRALDVLGLLRRPGAYTEHCAVHEIDLDIHRGERVAIIGRNGAGKSTLLKLITQVAHPTSGSVEVGGKLHALLSLGTGFHPELTGRENVFAYLATAGISGARARELFQGIADFAEIDDYLDQPLKTYSTGMGVRLMFSTSTAIEPEILVLDEVLGVGDAYFVNKSLERIKDLCEREGTTLLLVTHDIYSAMTYCDRMLWIDRGRVFQDGPAEVVVKAYETSIRLQEEERLRLRSQRQEAVTGEAADSALTYFQLVPENRLAIRQRIGVGSISLRVDEQTIDTIEPRSGVGKRAGSRLATENGAGNWSQPVERGGRPWRDLLTYGSIFHRGPFTVALTAAELDTPGLCLDLELETPATERLYLEGYAPDGRSVSVPIPERAVGTTRLQLPFAAQPRLSRRQVLGLASQGDLSASGDRFGTRRVRIEQVRLCGASGHAQHLFGALEPASVEIDVEVVDPTFAGSVTVLIAFHREGVRVTTRMIDEGLELLPQPGRYTIRADMDPFLIGPGEYDSTVGIYEGAYFSKNSGAHFATSSRVLDVIRHAFHFEVQDRSLHYTRLEYAQPCCWTVNARAETVADPAAS
ncbi:MAG: ABC transporter ATP-binding protein [Planctomycetota bacterium]